MGIFGWSYPPGVSSVPGDEPDPPCEVCGGFEWDETCLCPECPVCYAYGDPFCYIEHGLRRTEEQKFQLEANNRKWEYENWCETMSYAESILEEI